jgi:hypothetical protein
MGARDSAALFVAAIGSNSGQVLRITQVPADGQPIAGETMDLAMGGTISGDSIALVAQGGGVMRFADVLVWLVGSTTTVYSIHGWLTE